MLKKYPELTFLVGECVGLFVGDSDGRVVIVGGRDVVGLSDGSEDNTGALEGCVDRDSDGAPEGCADISRTADTTASQVRMLSFIVIEENTSEEAERTVTKELSAILDLNVSWTVS